MIDPMQHTGLAHDQLRKFGFHPWEDRYEDALQECLMTLTKASRGFDESRGWKFSTYATTGIKNTLILYLKRQARRARVETQEINEADKCGGEDDAFIAAQSKELWVIARHVLTKREMEVMQMLYVDGMEAYQIARQFRQSRQNIFLLKASALGKIRAELL